MDDDKTATPKSEFDKSKSDFDKSGKSDISSHDFNKQDSSNTPKRENIDFKKMKNENNDVV